MSFSFFSFSSHSLSFSLFHFLFFFLLILFSISILFLKRSNRDRRLNHFQTKRNNPEYANYGFLSYVSLIDLLFLQVTLPVSHPVCSQEEESHIQKDLHAKEAKKAHLSQSKVDHDPWNQSSEKKQFGRKKKGEHDSKSELHISIYMWRRSRTKHI